MKNTISIIIPTLNEANIIEKLIKYLHENFPNTEIIVSDGGSTDDTVSIVSGLAKVVNSKKGRALQMNSGAKAASGDILWFLHADCFPSPKSVDLILNAFKDKTVVGGGFRWGLDGKKWYYKITTYLAHFKNKLKSNLFGDMGIFVREDVFTKLKGYADIPLMEDVEFNKRLKKYGKIVILDEILLSSDRKLLKKGPIKTFIINNLIKFAYRLGISPTFLVKLYYKE